MYVYILSVYIYIYMHINVKGVQVLIRLLKLAAGFPQVTFRIFEHSLVSFTDYLVLSVPSTQILDVSYQYVSEIMEGPYFTVLRASWAPGGSASFCCGIPQYS